MSFIVPFLLCRYSDCFLIFVDMITHEYTVISDIEVRISVYPPGASSGRKEAHVTFVPVAGSEGNVSDQLNRIVCAYDEVMRSYRIDGCVAVMKRAFLSDVTNQAQEASDVLSVLPGALSVIGQCPCRQGVKAALLMIMTTGVTPDVTGNVTVVRRPPYTDIWTMSLTAPGDSYSATRDIFSTYISSLAPLRLSCECKRTWLYMRDIDTRYDGMVKARNEVFREQGLTPSHGFIASTGIEGASSDREALVTFDAFAVNGLKKGQTRHLSALGNLNATTDYGVAFERATAIVYGDRTHILVSGTASIGSDGQIVAPGDVAMQTRRAISNIEALLADGGGALADLVHAVVYVRDPSDAGVVSRIVTECLADVPFVIVHAPVCRPGWLVEIECMAITDAGDPAYADY